MVSKINNVVFFHVMMIGETFFPGTENFYWFVTDLHAVT